MVITLEGIDPDAEIEVAQRIMTRASHATYYGQTMTDMVKRAVEKYHRRIYISFPAPTMLFFLRFVYYDIATKAMHVGIYPDAQKFSREGWSVDVFFLPNAEPTILELRRNDPTWSDGMIAINGPHQLMSTVTESVEISGEKCLHFVISDI